MTAAPNFRPPTDARSVPRPGPAAPGQARRALTQILLERGTVRPAHVIQAASLAGDGGQSVPDILLARGWVSAGELDAARQDYCGAAVVDLAANPPDPRLIDLVGAAACLQLGLVPIRRLGGATIVATARPERFAETASRLPPALGRCLMAFAPEDEITRAVLARRGAALARAAETRTEARDSCRSFDRRRISRRALLALALGLATLWLAPFGTMLGLAAIAVAGLVAASWLKLAAVAASVIPGEPEGAPPSPPPAILPLVTMIVPLLGEAGIARRLVTRLSALDYPPERLDILLVTEQADHATRAGLGRLPPWMRVITAPEGGVRTKPRALNFALNFARGEIVGVWDAEDAPAADQLLRVARRFGAAGPDVACLQGVLDFYQRRRNWLSRCFAIEYAVWFRAVLPGLARLGLVVPLGGTTLFFRRDALERIGGWDAHNVTEDADLGLRLARRGYRTELIGTVTEEEPNARALPWIRQRSRWLKGYAATWAVHMRDPVRLYRDLGPWRFTGVQILFLGTVLQFLLAPVLWSFWLLAWALPNPYQTLVPVVLLGALAGVSVLAELINIGAGILATRRAGHRDLMVWVPTMILYFPLGTAAALKAAYELVGRPFYWDKTEHGIFADEPRGPAIAEARPSGPLLLLNPVVRDDARAERPRRGAARLAAR